MWGTDLPAGGTGTLRPDGHRDDAWYVWKNESPSRLNIETFQNANSITFINAYVIKTIYSCIDRVTISPLFPICPGCDF